MTHIFLVVLVLDRDSIEWVQVSILDWGRGKKQDKERKCRGKSIQILYSSSFSAHLSAGVWRLVAIEGMPSAQQTHYAYTCISVSYIATVCVYAPTETKWLTTIQVVCICTTGTYMYMIYHNLKTSEIQFQINWHYNINLGHKSRT